MKRGDITKSIMKVLEFHIKHWVFRRTANHFLSQRVWCPVFALGNKQCAPKPKSRTNAERLREQRSMKKKRIVNSSIFNWSQSL